MNTSGETVSVEHTLREILRRVQSCFDGLTNSGRVMRKERLDIVTERDIELQREIVQIIKRNHPNHAIWAEESAVAESAISSTGGHLWIVDPIDGTINFAAGLPLFAVSVAYLRDGVTELGGILTPGFQKCYWAKRGGGAFCGQERIHVSKRKLADSVVGIDLTSHFDDKAISSTVKLISDLAVCTRGVRVITASALELAWVAQGLIEANLCVKADPFGNAAGALLVEEAGGTVSDLDGEPWNPLDTATIMASNSLIHAKLLVVC